MNDLIEKLLIERKEIVTIIENINRYKRRIRADIILNNENHEVKAKLTKELASAIHSVIRAESRLFEIGIEIKRENIIVQNSINKIAAKNKEINKKLQYAKKKIAANKRELKISKKIVDVCKD